MPSSADSPLLEVRGLAKRFPGVVALRNVSLALQRAEVLAVIGENGAGKSTLMKILAGVQTQDAGDIRLNGQSVSIDSVHTAEKFGIALIHQELNLADNLTVAANVFLGREPLRYGLIDTKRMERETLPLLAQVGLDCSPGRLVQELSLGCQQMVEIAKALAVGARVLIMDEPTSSLSQHETDQLYAVVKDLRQRGVSIVYISHRLGEVSELADRVVVLRDGQNAGELSRTEITHEAMIRLMVGRDLSQLYKRPSHAPGDPVLEADKLRTPANPRHALSLSVRSGEIVGIAGLVGAGRTELLRALFGIDRVLGGTIRVAGKRVELSGPHDAIEAGMALVPEDRKQQGLVLGMTVRPNLSLASLLRDSSCGFLNHAAEKDITATMIRDLKIRTPGPEQTAQFLSGGNQQKIVLGKWLAMKPRILLLDEPTRGIDVGAKQEIYRLLDNLAAQGVAILFVSSEMEEIIRLADRAIVMHEGRITGELARAECSEEAIMRLATGDLQDIRLS
jgi:ribose transport system ATP-binding protein